MQEYEELIKLESEVKIQLENIKKRKATKNLPVIFTLLYKIS